MAKAVESVTETALVPATTGADVNYPALVGSAPDVMAKIERNLGGRSMTANDLMRIKVPTGGGTTWEVDEEDEEGGSVKKLNAVVIHSRLIRACWNETFSGGNNPPDCSSDNGKNAMDGTPCATCPNAQFGSKENGRGQKCKQMQQLFLLLPGYFLPVILNVPPSSIKNYSNYAIKVGSRGNDMFEVVTELSLEKDKSGEGIEYSKIRFKKSGALSPEMATIARALGMSVAGVAGGPNASDYSEAAQY